MQGSKTVERAARTRTKSTERTEKALARNCSRSLASEVLLLELFDCTPPPS